MCIYIYENDKQLVPSEDDNKEVVRIYAMATSVESLPEFPVSSLLPR